jgi:hypothetical protein
MKNQKRKCFKNISTFAPIALFGYKRPIHLKNAVDALKGNAEAVESELYVFLDGAKTNAERPLVDSVRAFAKTIEGFKNITLIEQSKNMGLSKSITSGVNHLVNKNGCVIVVEDDLIVSPFFLKFINDGLRRFEHDNRIASILGYSLPISSVESGSYFVRGADCYGWGTWKRAWDLNCQENETLLQEIDKSGLSRVLNMNGAIDYTKMLKDKIAGVNDSWAVNWHVSMFLQNKLTLVPAKSLVINAGMDGSGENFGVESILKTTLSKVEISLGDMLVEENVTARRKIENYYRKYNSLPQRLLRLFFRITQRFWSMF